MLACVHQKEKNITANGESLQVMGYYRRNVNKDGTGMLSYDNDLPLPVLVPMKTSFSSAKALKLSLG
jgi:hypothetical protein